MSQRNPDERTEFMRQLASYDRAVQRAAAAVRAYRSTAGHDRASVLEHLDAALQAGFDVLEPIQEITDFPG
jgi:hypothetical protein